MLYHTMAHRLLGNGGALPPVDFKADNNASDDSLDSSQVGKQTDLLWLIVLVMNLLIVVVLPCISILIQKTNERRQPNNSNGSEESEPQEKLN
jgi:hypothetical protein